MKKIIVIILTVAIFALAVFWLMTGVLEKNQKIFFARPPEKNFWEVQSVDTMKYSRDVAYEKLTDASFDAEIERQARLISDVGATHIAIGAPYDEKFFPYLQRWVVMARKYDLKVWFRGNWSGWEGWFGYPKEMTREEHVQETREFILNHPDIFADGDIFTSCPECENGGPGDPRHNNDAVGHRKFIIDEYVAAKESFAAINKKVKSNYFSMNGDVARLIMDKETTRALDGIVTIDHYVATPQKLVADISAIAKSSGGKVVLGEWGVAIPDIHGKMTETESALWIEQALKEMLNIKKELIGMNYWLAVGGGTELWPLNSDSSPMSLALKKYYQPQIIYGRVINKLSQPIGGARIALPQEDIIADKKGYFEWRGPEQVLEMEIFADGYDAKKISPADSFHEIVLERSDPGLFFHFFLWLKNVFN